MRVLINRQDAIDALTENKEMINAALDSLTLDYNTRRDQEQRRGQINEDIETIKALPSAQPEIIHCRDCKHHHYESKDIPYCDRIDYGYGWKDDDFCSRAERITE